jgi:hypothetical protein
MISIIPKLLQGGFKGVNKLRKVLKTVEVNDRRKPGNPALNEKLEVIAYKFKNPYKTTDEIREHFKNKISRGAIANHISEAGLTSRGLKPSAIKDIDAVKKGYADYVKAYGTQPSKKELSEYLGLVPSGNVSRVSRLTDMSKKVTGEDAFKKLKFKLGTATQGGKFDPGELKKLKDESLKKFYADPDIPKEVKKIRRDIDKTLREYNQFFPNDKKVLDHIDSYWNAASKKVPYDDVANWQIIGKKINGVKAALYENPKAGLALLTKKLNKAKGKDEREEIAALFNEQMVKHRRLVNDSEVILDLKGLDGIPNKFIRYADKNYKGHQGPMTYEKVLNQLDEMQFDIDAAKGGYAMQLPKGLADVTQAAKRAGFKDGKRVDPDDIDLEIDDALSQDGEVLTQKEAIDRIIERMFSGFSVGGIVGGVQSGVPISTASNDVGIIESILSGIGAGLIDIPKGAFSLGASLIDLGLGTDHAAKVEKFFDDLTTLDEKAEETLAGNLSRIVTNLGVPGAAGFRIGAGLAKQAMVARKANKYFKIGRKIKPRMDDALNAQGRLLTTLGGSAGVGVADAIFVGDPEQVGTIGDMFEAGPTALRPNDDNDAAREVMNRMKFGLESSLLLGLVGATGSALKTGIKRADDLQDNNGFINKVLSKFRPRGDKPQQFFDLERGQIGERSADLNRAQEIQRSVDKEIDAIFPYIKKGIDQTPEVARKDFYKQINDVLLSGNLEKGIAPNTIKFSQMNKKQVTKLTKELKDKGVPQKNIDALLDRFEDARSQFGDMFTSLGGRMDDTQLDEFINVFGKKVGDYLDTSYTIFGNAGVAALRNFKPGDEAVDQAIELVKALHRDKTKSVSIPKGKELSDEAAEHYVQKIVETAEVPQRIIPAPGRAQGVTIASDEAFLTKKTVLDEVEEIGSKIGVNQLKKKITIDGKTYEPRKVVQELLGKTDDPNRTILASMSKLSLLTRRNEFLDALVKTSNDNPKGKRFFYDNEIDAIAQYGRENVRKINMDPAGKLNIGEMVNPVNGKFTSKGIADALEETSKNVLGDGMLNNIYSNFILYPKATSQLAKTVLSPITHFRNFVSAGAFAAGNGIIPNLEAFQTAFKSLQTPLKGTREQNEFYRKLLRLGVVNSNVRLGDLQRLLSDVNFGSTVSSMPALKKLVQTGSKLKKGAEEFYTAEDDFWKITSFAMERQRYEKAFARAGIKKSADELDELAADIVRNNIPNYDYVNDFIKGLRKFPVGNFVSFPAEIMRTSANIIKRAVDDIKFVDEATGTAPLRAIGYQRLFGFGATAVAIPYGTVEAAKALYNVSGDEMDALKRFVPEWSKNSTLVPIRGDDGELKYIDFSHANAYDTMIRPITTIINNIQNGDDDRTIVQNIFKGMFEATQETLSPFVSEAIWTQAATDIFIRGGRTRDGRRLYTEQTPLGEKAYITAAHLVESQLPGSITQFKRLGLSVTENPDKYGREFEFGDELAGVLGFRTIKVDPVNSMKFKIADFTRGISNARREFTTPLLRGGAVSPEDIVDRYQVANRQLYKVQREMTKDYYAALTLGSPSGSIDGEFADRVSKIQLSALKAGRFKPFIPSENVKKSFAENARALGSANPYTAASSEINRLAREYGKINYLTDRFPLFDNPFGGLDISLPSAISPGNLPSVVGGQLPAAVGTGATNTIQKGQTVFGPLDPIFGS